jgi:hypothetical protein
MWEKMYKSTVKKKWPYHKKWRCYQYFAIVRTPICYIFLLIIAIGISAPFTWPPWDLYKEAWFLMGFYLILHALASNVQVSDNWSSTSITKLIEQSFSYPPLLFCIPVCMTVPIGWLMSLELKYCNKFKASGPWDWKQRHDVWYMYTIWKDGQFLQWM